MTAPSRSLSVPTPIWAVVTLTFLSSVGSAVMYSGVFALAQQLYAFGKWSNFALAVVWGLAYIPGALAAGPIVRYAGRRSTALSPLAVLLVVMFLMGLMSALPVLASERVGLLPGGSWVIWVAVGVYGFLSGIHWPIVESFGSGGRGGHELQAATGKFNISWSSSVVFGMLAMGPFLKHHSVGILGAMAAIHVVGLALTWSTFPRYPGKHGPTSEHGGPGGCPPIYKDLLIVFRLLLPAAFILSAALTPYFPSAIDALGLDTAWKTGLAAAWMGPRLLTFFVLDRRRGWHGTWAMPIIGGVVLLGGFAAAVLAPTLGPTPAGRALMIAGLALFGVGVGTIYTGALYYAMEAGSAEVDAGGMHEALIGIGYTVGPICGLAGLLMAHHGVVGEKQDEVAMLILASAAALLLAGIAAWQVRGRTRNGRTAG